MQEAFLQASKVLFEGRVGVDKTNETTSNLPVDAGQNRTLVFSEVLQDPSNPNSLTNFYLTEQGDEPLLFYAAEPPPIIVQQGAVEVWTVENHAEENHVMHIHQLHFSVLEAINIDSINFSGGTPYILGQFVDTVVFPYSNGTAPWPTYKFLMDFTKVDVGDFVVHCHMAQHEDQGMTTVVRVAALS